MQAAGTAARPSAPGAAATTTTASPLVPLPLAAGADAAAAAAPVPVDDGGAAVARGPRATDADPCAREDARAAKRAKKAERKAKRQATRAHNTATRDARPWVRARGEQPGAATRAGGGKGASGGIDRLDSAASEPDILAPRAQPELVVRSRALAPARTPRWLSRRPQCAVLAGRWASLVRPVPLAQVARARRRSRSGGWG